MHSEPLKRIGGRSRTVRRYLIVGLLAAAVAAYFHESADDGISKAAAIDTAGGGDSSPTTTETSERGLTDRPRQLVLEMERALVSGDPRQRETAFGSVLPELLAESPERVPAIVARTEPGEVRDALRDEVVRQWMERDSAAAAQWMHTLEDETERRASAVTAVRTLASSSPARAIQVADEFGVGRDDGSLEHLVQIWATEKPGEAMRWIESQPEGAATEQLRERIEHVLGHPLEQPVPEHR